jgi:hypothetical protein
MNMEEVRRLKQQLEESLRDEIASFHRQSGLAVTDVSLTRHEAREGMTGATVVTAYEVNVRAEF